MTTSLSPYGYDPSMLAAVDAIYFQEDQHSATATFQTATQSCNKASLPPLYGCPLLELPYEIRAQILSYILPCTIRSAIKDVIWLRGHTAIFPTCHALYEECKGILYRNAVFLIDIHFDRIIFNYQWLIATDFTKTNYGQNLGPEYSTAQCSHKLIPSQKIDFVSKFSFKLRSFMRKFMVRVHLVDGYDGMIMYNTAKEEVLIKGIVAQFDRFYDQTQLSRGKESARELLLKLVGPAYSQEKFKKTYTKWLNEPYDSPKSLLYNLQ